MPTKGTGKAAGGLPPVGVPFEVKQGLAMDMIKEEQDYMDQRGWDVVMSEDGFGELPRTEYTRNIRTGDILSGMVIRGRLQAAVFDTFMELCLQGVCCLSALEYPVDWRTRSNGDNAREWISRMLAVFSCYRANMDLVQAYWGMRHGSRWFDYDVPFLWFETVVARSFTSLDAVFNIARCKGLFGVVNAGALKRLEESFPPNPDWKADISTNSTNGWYGSGTFACWLPDNIDPGLTQLGVYDGVMALSKGFHMRLARTEMHHAVFFDINGDAEYADVADVVEGALN